MTRLIIMIRVALWLAWLVPYVVLAAWVGQGEFDHTDTRFVATMGAAIWAYIGLFMIEMPENPKKIAKALMEDE